MIPTKISVHNVRLGEFNHYFIISPYQTISVIGYGACRGGVIEGPFIGDVKDESNIIFGRWIICPS